VQEPEGIAAQREANVREMRDWYKYLAIDNDLRARRHRAMIRLE